MADKFMRIIPLPMVLFLPFISVTFSFFWLPVHLATHSTLRQLVKLLVFGNRLTKFMGGVFQHYSEITGDGGKPVPAYIV